MLKIIGYCNPLSVAPGERIRFMVHCEEEIAYQAGIVRIIHGDANPDGPGFKAEQVPAVIAGQYQGQPQKTDLGSYMRVANHPRFARLQSFTFAAMIWPTLPRRGRQVLFSKWEPETATGVRLEIDAGGGLTGIIASDAGGHTIVEINAGQALLTRRWYLVALSYDHHSRQLALVQRPAEHWPYTQDSALMTKDCEITPMLGPGELLIAATSDKTGAASDKFDGKIDSPMILDTAVPAAALDGLFCRPVAASLRRHVLAHWDFSKNISTTNAADLGPLGLDGTLVNLPARAMTGWNWTGEHNCWSDHPEQYGAIHFHSDDIYDCGWQPAFEWQIPADQPSGAYAARIWCGNNEDGHEEDYITFFVRPPRGQAGKKNRPKAALLIPTASYLAYANDHNHLDAELAEPVIGRLLVYQWSDLYIHEHRELGLSLYDSHADGSGVCYSSYLRPVLNLRPKYASWLGAHGSGLWQFNADTHLIDWLEQQDFDYDVITDEDLHAEGASLLEPYRVVLSGTHPEYHSKRMSDAMMAWLDSGGRLMYLGGNGWYWRIAWDQQLPGVIEVRRAEGGTRSWAAEPGEYYHSFSGEFGGLWRRNGRPPNAVVGLGFSAQGFDISTYYRRQPDSDNPRAGFIFENVDGDIIGDFGLVGGGAAGLEFDRVDYALGSPPNTLVLASSEYHTDLILPVVEETNVMTPDLTGSQSDRVRADLAFFETPAGGAVFSVGSISWCGSLSHKNYTNNVSQITGNVLRRFLDPEPFL